ncbi:MAG: FkbM family methyltransferase [Parvularculaceae bacterium]|nr:FkbM family methyltransferase [Parvularculaceae bacterium]
MSDSGLGACDFGACAPSPREERWRRLAHRLPYNYWGRKAASLLLGPAGGRSGRPADVAVFGAQRARLHPSDNICEKRVYITPQLWDPAERAILAVKIRDHASDVFIFADIGANAGLYSLFARAECLTAQKNLRAICVEADPEMRRRLGFNIAASGAETEIAVAACAAAARDGRMRFHVEASSRGLSRLDDAGEIEVQARPITSILADSKFDRIDAMKIDIEGAEFEALEAFFNTAAPPLRPGLLIVETSHEAPGRSVASLVQRHGYETILKTRLNTVLKRENAV